jgi:hypothetical protein
MVPPSAYAETASPFRGRFTPGARDYCDLRSVKLISARRPSLYQPGLYKLAADTGRDARGAVSLFGPGKHAGVAMQAPDLLDRSTWGESNRSSFPSVPHPGDARAARALVSCATGAISAQQIVANGSRPIRTPARMTSQRIADRQCRYDAGAPSHTCEGCWLHTPRYQSLLQ